MKGDREKVLHPSCRLISRVMPAAQPLSGQFDVVLVVVAGEGMDHTHATWQIFCSSLPWFLSV